jgi:hypothetical protein
MMKNLNEPRKTEPDVIPFDSKTAIRGERHVEDLRGQWTRIQSSFVDEPRKAVEEADKLVASAIKQIQEKFSTEKTTLERQWSRGEQVSTEDLRVCMQHYRDFFENLLSRL